MPILTTSTSAIATRKKGSLAIAVIILISLTCVMKASVRFNELENKLCSRCVFTTVTIAMLRFVSCLPSVRKASTYLYMYINTFCLETRTLNSPNAWAIMPSKIGYDKGKDADLEIKINSQSCDGVWSCVVALPKIWGALSASIALFRCESSILRV